MDAPTFTSVSPSVLYTGGQLITITGTNFQTRYPIDPSTPHPWPAPTPSMSVLIDGVPTTKVSVTSTSISCLVSRSHAPGVSSITLTNLDASGNPRPGETTTIPNALTFARADLTVDSDLSVVTMALVTEIKNQVIQNVSLTTSVDYSSDPNSVVFAGVDIAKLPAVCVSGPSVVRNRFYDLTPRFELQEPDGSFSRRTTFE